MKTLVVAAVLLLAPRANEDLAALAAEGRWDDLIALCGERVEAAERERRDDAEARLWLGRAWLAKAEDLLAGSPLRLGRDLAAASLERAAEQLERAGAEGAAQLARACGLRGDLALDLDDPDAEAWFRRATDAEPSDVVSWMRLARLRGETGRLVEGLQAWDRARAAWSRAISSSTIDRDYVAGELLACLQFLLPAATDAPARQARLDELLAQGWPADDALLQWYRADALAAQGRTAEAEAALAGATRGQSAGSAASRARLLAALGRREEAVEVLLPWVARGDDLARDTLLDLADALALERRWKLALDGYESVLESAPDHERAQRNRALTLSYAGREEEARAAWSTLVGRRPERADLLNDAALMAWAAGRRDEALQRWRQAVAATPDGRAVPALADVRENLAAALLRLDPAEARRLLDDVLASEPGRDRALVLLFLLDRPEG